jgi:pyruvate dehydrogenase E2 component (dihydrolipoamide acetyltransferase)
VPIGANLAIVGKDGEDYSDLLSDQSAAAAAEEPSPEAAGGEEDVTKTTAVPASNGAAQATTGEFPAGVKATPVARRIAADKNIDLSQVSASGPGGRIRKADVEAYLANPPKAATRPAVAAAEFAIPEGDDVEVIETTKLRQAIGRRMTESKTTVPHFYITSEVDMAPALALRKEINATLPDESRVTVNDLIVKAAALALREFPNLNASFAGKELVRYNYINVGTAVAVEGGLLTVVQKNTDKATLSTIAAENKAMIARARDGRVKPEDVEGATFTVSNLGAFDVDHFIAIINPPDAAILAVGSARQVPVVVDGELAVGTRMKITVSADHRVTDGAEAAQFLQAVKRMLENPLRMLV